MLDRCACSTLLFTLSAVLGNHRCPECLPAILDTPKVPLKKKHKQEWIVDSGATVHCVNDFSLLTSVYTDRTPVSIKVADKRVLRSHAVGTVVTHLKDSEGRDHQITLHNVVYHPEFGCNLLSVRRLWRDNRLSTKFREHNYLKCSHTGAKFPFSFSGQYRTQTANAAVSTSKHHVDSDLLHSRFGHCSARRLGKLVERSRRMPKCNNLHSHDPSTCDACKSGGAKRKPFHKREGNPFTYFGERLSSDMCGPFTKSVEGYTYMLNIVDACTNDLSVHFLYSKSSSEVKDAMEQFLRDNRAYLPHDKPVTWHTDNGGEFTSNDLNEFCDEFALKRSFSVPYAPPQNAHAERMWGILLRPMRIMLAESGVHESFWTYAATQACMLHNVLPSTKLAGEMSPYQAKYKVLPDVGNIRVWGCTCWYYLPEHERESKLSPRAVPAIHLGGDPQRHGYLVYVPYLNRITSAYHLSFQERKFLKFTDDGIVNLPKNIKPLRDLEPLYGESREKHVTHPDNHEPISVDEPTSDYTPEKCDHPKCTLPKHPDSIPHSFEQRETRNYGRNPPRDRGPNYVPPRYAELTVTDQCFTTIMIAEDVNEQALQIAPEHVLSDCPTPDTYDQAIKSRQSERWKQSMTQEITDLMKNDTWELVKRNEVKQKVAKSKWVYKIKLNKDGSIERFKSRFVVCGYSQVKGVDYTHSFSATLRATSMRLLLALAAGKKLKLEHFDVTNAFTQSDIDSEIYVEPPKGFEKYDENGKSYVLKLKRALYGTKQASRMWQLKLRSHLITKMGFTNSSHDPCLFSRHWDDGTVILVGVYVDDIILAHNGKLDWFIKEFTGPNGFRAKHVGPLSWFLGMSVHQGSDYSVEANQEQYITKLVEKFAPARTASLVKHAMPCNPLVFQKLSTAKDDSERDKMAKLPYLQLIGSLLYLTLTRPDIYYHMSILCSFMHDPSPDAYYAAIDLLLYVYNTKHYRLTYSGSVRPPSGVDPRFHSSINTSGGLVAYSDSSWRNPDKLGYNCFGYVIYLYGGPISYAAKNLKIVALSSAEAEYAAASYTCKECQFVRKVLSDIGFAPKGPIVLAVDNQAAIKIAENVGVTGRTKHFVDAIHYFRHLVDHQVIVPTFVRTNHQCADGFTKPLAKGPYREWVRRLLSIDEK